MSVLGQSRPSDLAPVLNNGRCYSYNGQILRCTEMTLSAAKRRQTHRSMIGANRKTASRGGLSETRSGVL